MQLFIPGFIWRDAQLRVSGVKENVNTGQNVNTATGSECDRDRDTEVSEYLQANFAQPVLQGAEEEEEAEEERMGHK